MKLWSDLALRFKIIVIGSFIIVSFGIVIFAYILPSMETSIYNKKKEKIENIIQSCIAIIDGIDKDAQKNNLTRAEAQQKAIGILRSLRYGDTNDDYVWINDLNLLMIMHPFVTDLEGKSLKDYKDKTGDLMFQKMVDIGNSQGKGFHTYMWQKGADAKTIVPKLSFIQVYKPWNWLVGTGVYIEDLKEEIFRMKLSLIVVTIVLAALAWLLLYLFALNISKRITTLKNCLEKAKDGNLDCAITNSSLDDIGHMLNAFNSFVDRINSIVKEVKVSSEQLSTSSVELAASADTFAKNSQTQAASTEEMTATIEEVSGGVESIAHETNNQLGKINQVQEKIASLNDDILEMNQQVSETRNLTSHINGLTKSSEESLKSMSANMDKINNSSQEMKQIIGIINDISDKINLLSLNAAIEAARAGDAGRGFAVVADEISKLADQTASSIKEIGTRIRENEDEITKFSSNVAEVLQLLNSIIEGIVSIGKMSDSVSTTMNSGLEKNRLVTENFADLIQKAENINIATSEQKTAMDEMVKSVSEITSVAQATASSSEEIAGSSEELSGVAAVLKDRVEFFSTKG
jgi:methyl-accepting chemotaxis protein